jgi:hypothetical protein
MILESAHDFAMSLFLRIPTAVAVNAIHLAIGN